MTTTPETTTAPHQPGELVHLDPNAIALDKNIRKQVRLDRAFRSSIKQHGVQIPVLVYWDDVAGAWQGKDGQRRILAARDAGVATVPAFVVDEALADQLILDQLIVNTHREQLTASDTAAAYKQLELFGHSSDSVQRKANLPEAEIQAGMKIAGAEKVMRVLEKTPTLDLAAAEILTEFENDAPALKELLDVAERSPAGLDHAAQRIRRQREEAALRDRLAEEIRKTGVALVDRPDYYDRKTTPLGILVDKKTGDNITPEQHASCPGAAAYIGSSNYYGETIEIIQVCTDPAKYGHRNTQRAAPVQSTEAEKAAKRKDRADKVAWVDASTVRLQWIRDHLANLHDSSIHSDAHELIAKQAAGVLFRPNYSEDKTLALELLGAKQTRSVYQNDYYGLGAFLDNNPTRRLTLALARALAGMELTIGVAGGKYSGERKPWNGSESAVVVPYLQYLASKGYQLSDIESEITVKHRKKAVK